MTSFRTLERRIEGEIMNTDILLRIASAHATKEAMAESLDQAFRLMRQFADRFSRFIEGNELWQFNQSTGGTVSSELFDLLMRAKKHYQETDKRFDPSVLPALEQEGYTGAYRTVNTNESYSFADLTLDSATHQAKKPLALKVDLGGFGKGYIADQVADRLNQIYPHVLVDAGGDIAVRGSDVGRGITGWTIGVENPTQPETDLCLLSLSDTAVATSGKNRRTWKSEATIKHHLIDPETRRSSESDLLSVTVIAPRVEEADVMAKTLFLMGSADGKKFALQHSLPAIFCTTNTFEINPFAQTYVWHAA